MQNEHKCKYQRHDSRYICMFCKDWYVDVENFNSHDCPDRLIEPSLPTTTTS